MTLVDRVTARFTEVVGADPLGVWSAPGRITVIGDHTDYNAGLSLPIAIDLSVVVAVGIRDDGRVRVVSPFDDTTTVELARCVPGSVSGWAAVPLGVLWALGGSRGGATGLDIVIDSDIPAGQDFGASSAIACAVAVAVNDLWEIDLGRMELVHACQRAEHDMVGTPTTMVDTATAMFGETDSAVLVDCQLAEATAVPFALDDARLALLVIVSDGHRSPGGDVNQDRRASCQRAAGSLGVETLRDLAVNDLTRVRETQDEETYRRVRHVVTENARVAAVSELLWSDGPRAIGDFLSASYLSMRDDFDVHNAHSARAIHSARRAGALGARMTGGGLGGVVIALVPTELLAFVERKVHQAFTDEHFGEPELFVVTPSRGAHRVY
ncbi:MAG: galactokinase [Microbacteriaceae bacterium]|nr:galactokinase [Microbacteriaceae bacterium]